MAKSAQLLSALIKVLIGLSFKNPLFAARTDIFVA